MQAEQLLPSMRLFPPEAASPAWSWMQGFCGWGKRNPLGHTDRGVVGEACGFGVCRAACEWDQYGCVGRVCVCVCTPCACMSLCTSGLAASGQVSCQGRSRTPPAAEQNPCAKHTWWQCLEERSPLGLSPRPGGGDWPRTAAASQGCLGPERERGSRCAENTAKGFGICLRPQLTGDFLPGSRGREHAHHRRPQPPPLPLSPPTGGLPSSTHTLR